APGHNRMTAAALHFLSCARANSTARREKRSASEPICPRISLSPTPDENLPVANQMYRCDDGGIYLGMRKAKCGVSAMPRFGDRQPYGISHRRNTWASISNRTTESILKYALLAYTQNVICIQSHQQVAGVGHAWRGVYKNTLRCGCG